MRCIAIVLGILASSVGVLSATFALIAVGADDAYASRLWAGWASLVLPILAGIAAIVITTRPRAASLTMLISGILGFICISLFFINTLYTLAIPLWFLSTVLACISDSTPTSENTLVES